MSASEIEKAIFRSKNIQEKENPNKKGKYKDKDHLNKAIHRSKQK